ncbi:MAG: hypothetical protein ACOYNH_11935, partial [Bacteroidia bacterium]
MNKLITMLVLAVTFSLQLVAQSLQMQTFSNNNGNTSLLSFAIGEPLVGNFPASGVGLLMGGNSNTLQSGYTTVANGDWNIGATWVGGTVPPAGADIVINHNVVLNQDATVSSLTINSGKTFTASDASARILTISNSISSTTLANSGTWANGIGGSTVLFAGTATHTVSGTLSLNNVTTTTGINFGTASTINNNFQINTGGSVSINPPTYGSSSTLIYNTATYTSNLEWVANTTTGAGVPQNVRIGNGTNTALDFGASAQYRYLEKNLFIDNGSSLTLSSTS